MIVIERRGAAMPALGLGTWPMRGREAVRAVESALALGYRHIDTAQMYGNEAEVGRAMAASGIDRSEIWLTTKLDNDAHAFEKVRSSTEESLRKLGTDYVDLLLIHWPVFDDAPLAETLDAMAELRLAGKVTHIGVSNFSTALVVEAVDRLGHDILCNQVEFHPYLSQRAVRTVCAQRDIIVTAYAPVVRGEVVRDEVLTEIGERHGKCAAQVCLRWLVQQPGVAAIPKAAGEARQRANLEIFDFALDEDEMARIHGLARGRRLIVADGWAPAWDPD